jgi:V8-like Glu-specific endopeptidase
MAGRAPSNYGSGMRKLVPVFVLLGALTACAVSDHSEGGAAVERSAAPIIGGTADAADPSVVMVLAQGTGTAGSAICTGELVSPHVVLTAAHCVSPQVAPAGATFAVFTGTNVNDTAQQSNPALWHEVKETHYDTAFNVNNLTGGHDIAVVILKQALNAPLLPINRTPLTTAQRNQPVRLIGYGVSSGSDTTGTTAGIKRQTSTTLSAFDAKFVYFYDSAHQTCEGDSGGPSLLKIGGVETIVGVVSFGTQGCTMGGTDTNVVQYLPFIDTYVSPDLAASTNLAPGVACDAASECKSGFCADGVCCDQACTGQCEACAEPGSAGKCTVVAAKSRPRPGHPQCSGIAACAGICDGVNRSGCVMPGKETLCGGGCKAGTLGTCNAGACATAACPGNLACASASACKTTCAADTDCVAGFLCKGGNCVDPAGPSTCSADGASSVAVDGTVADCAPFACDPASGTCRATCATNDDCTGGVTCDAATGACGSSTATTKSGGCALGHDDEGPSGGARSGAAIAACVAALALAKRRRR